MIIVRMPYELIEGLPIVFIVGLLIGIGWVFLADKFKGKSWGLFNRMTSIVFSVLMGVGVLGSFWFNHYQRNIEDVRIQEYIEQTTSEIREELSIASEERDFEIILKELYGAEYEVVRRQATNKTHTIPIGEVLINGGSSTVSKYLTELTTEDREVVLDTSKESLNSFTTLDFAQLDTEIGTESLKLGGFGRDKIKAVRTIQREILEKKVEKIDFSKDSFMKVFRDALIISFAFMLISVLISVLLLIMIKDMFRELGIRRFGIKEDEEQVDTDITETTEEYELVDGRLEEPVYVAKEEVDKEEVDKEEVDKEEVEEEDEEEDE